MEKMCLLKEIPISYDIHFYIYILFYIYIIFYIFKNISGNLVRNDSHFCNF